MNCDCPYNDTLDQCTFKHVFINLNGTCEEYAIYKNRIEKDKKSRRIVVETVEQLEFLVSVEVGTIVYVKSDWDLIAYIKYADGDYRRHKPFKIEKEKNEEGR
jgi:hypothetical protein